jgi:hypothetical protein
LIGKTEQMWPVFPSFMPRPAIYFLGYFLGFLGARNGQLFEGLQRIGGDAATAYRRRGDEKLPSTEIFSMKQRLTRDLGRLDGWRAAYAERRRGAQSITEVTHESEAAPMRSQKPSASTRRQPSRQPSSDRRALVSDPGARAMVGDISVMTKRRWQADPKIGWPKTAAVIRGRNYYVRADLEAFVDRLVELTASGEATTSAPNPRRRSAKKPQLVLEALVP